MGNLMENLKNMIDMNEDEEEEEAEISEHSHSNNSPSEVMQNSKEIHLGY